jgi:uncharacterized protein
VGASVAAAQPVKGTIWTGSIGQSPNERSVVVMVDGPGAGRISVPQLNMLDAALREARFEKDRMQFRLTRQSRGVEWVFDLRVNAEGNVASGTVKEGGNDPRRFELRRWDGKGAVPGGVKKADEPESVPAVPDSWAKGQAGTSATTPATAPTPAGAIPAPAAVPAVAVAPAPAPAVTASAPAAVPAVPAVPAAALPAKLNVPPQGAVVVPATAPVAAAVPAVPAAAPVTPVPAVAPVAPGAAAAGGGSSGGPQRLNPVIAGVSRGGEVRSADGRGGSAVTAPLPPVSSLPATPAVPDARPSGGLVPLTSTTAALSRPGTNVPQADGPAVAPPLESVAAPVVVAAAPAQAPVQAPVQAPAPAVSPTPVPVPVPVPPPVPALVPAPVPAAVPVAEPVVVVAPAAAVNPAPMPVVAPAPVAAPLQAAVESGQVFEGRVSFSATRASRITLRVDQEGQARVSIPEMAMFDLPAGPVANAAGGAGQMLDGADLRFEIPGLPASAGARLVLFKSSSNHGRYEGTLNHLGSSFAVRIAPSAAESTRPQTPRPPLPYSTRQMLVTASDGAKLPGTLSLPNSEVFGPGPHPAVVLLSGSGTQDRDQTIFGHKTLAVLADALARAGIGSLRCDDRGYLGHYNPAGNQITSLTLAADALVIHAALRGEIGVDSSRVGIMGHSEGGLLAAMAASQSPDVAFVGMLAAPTQIGRDVIARQVTTVRLAGQEIDEPTKAKLKAAFEKVVATMDDDQMLRSSVEELVRLQLGLNGTSLDEGSPAWTAVIDKGMREFREPWLRAYVKLDPAEYLVRVRVPTLAVFGSLDMQVNAEANAKRLRGVFPGSTPLKIEEMRGLNHLLQTASTGQVDEYAKIEETMAPEAISAIVRWATRVTGAKPVGSVQGMDAGGDVQANRGR